MKFVSCDISVDVKNADLTNKTRTYIVELYNLQQLVTIPTRVTTHSETIIGCLYTLDPDKVEEVFVPSIAVSDRYPICFTRSSSKNIYKRQNHNTIQYRCYTKLNEFLLDLSQTLDPLSISNTDTDSNFDTWSTRFMNVFNKHAPLKSKRVNRETQPEWLNVEIKSAM